MAERVEGGDMILHMSSQIKYFQVKSEFVSETELKQDFLTKQRDENPNWGLTFVSTGVFQSYPRWANIHLPVKVMPYSFPLTIIADRRMDGKFILWVVDPTNAHFYEKSYLDNDKLQENGIWMDVLDEVKRKLYYAMRCSLFMDIDHCSCSQTWSVFFYRMKEIPNEPFVNLSYGQKIQILAKARAQNMVMHRISFLFMREFQEKEMSVQTEDEQNTPVYFSSGECAWFGGVRNVMNPVEKGKLMSQICESPAKLSKSENCDIVEGAGMKLQRCSRCKKISYCGAECQKKDWKRHKKDCVSQPVDNNSDVVVYDSVTKMMQQLKLQNKKKD